MPHKLVIALIALTAGLAGCDASDGVTEAAPASAAPSVKVTDSPKPVPSPTPAIDGCPPDVNLMYEWLKVTPAVWSKLSKNTTGLLEPTCYRGWSMARTVVKNADSALVVFKIDPDTGRWNPVAAGTDNVCDAVGVPPEIQAKLGDGC